MGLTQGLQGFNCRDPPCMIFGLNLFNIIPQECRTVTITAVLLVVAATTVLLLVILVVVMVVVVD